MLATQDLHVTATQALISPRQLKEDLVMSEAANRTVIAGRAAVGEILRGEDDRLLVITGPCSIHDPQSALEYARRLRELSTELADRMCLVMRVYFEKPRTTVGWKGLLSDPRLDGSQDMTEGLRVARKLLLDINEIGLPAATESLDPITPQYVSDLVSWAAIGARTTESQTHREMASGMSMPVGFKNSTSGICRLPWMPWSPPAIHTVFSASTSTAARPLSARAAIPWDISCFVAESMVRTITPTILPPPPV